MTENQVLKHLLAELAKNLDSPEGPGSGAVCLDAIAALESMEERLPPAAPPLRPPDQ